MTLSMSISKAHVMLFFERNPALREREAEVLSRLPDSHFLSEAQVEQALGETLYRFFRFDEREDKPLRGKEQVANHEDSYVGVSLSYVE